MRNLIPPSFAFALCFLAEPAVSQSQGLSEVTSALAKLRSEQAALLGRLEVNLALSEVHEKKNEELELKFTHLTEQQVENNADMDRANAFCHGTFPNEEFQRRNAQCTTWQGGIEGRQRDVDNEWANVAEQRKDLARQDQVRAAEAEQTAQSLIASATRRNEICALLPFSPERTQSCGAPLPSTARTAELVAGLQERFDAIEDQCARLIELERRVECQRQVWDGNVYTPSRPVVVGPD